MTGEVWSEAQMAGKHCPITREGKREELERERNWRWPCVVCSLATMSALTLESRVYAQELSGRG